ncbi:hypothetical protein BDA99DRAFT_482809, partial [Phascolomyces articulosus]
MTTTNTHSISNTEQQFSVPTDQPIISTTMVVEEKTLEINTSTIIQDDPENHNNNTNVKTTTTTTQSNLLNNDTLVDVAKEDFSNYDETAEKLQVNSSDEEENNDKKTELIQEDQDKIPDGGYGWLVVAGSFFVHLICF